MILILAAATVTTFGITFTVDETTVTPSELITVCETLHTTGLISGERLDSCKSAPAVVLKIDPRPREQCIRENNHFSADEQQRCLSGFTHRWSIPKSSGHEK
jgi:hypothetical protein